MAKKKTSGTGGTVPEAGDSADVSGTTPNTKAPNPQPPSWRDQWRIHPAAELFPLMTPDEVKALSEDIKEYGIKQRVTFWCAQSSADFRDWEVLDGRNRLDAMELVGEQLYKSDGRLGDNWWRVEPASTDPYAYVVSANIHRRHLTREQQNEVIAKLLQAAPEKSDRTIAEQVKVDHKRVGRVRRGLEATGAMPQLAATVGKDGKARARRAPPPLVPTTEELNRRFAEWDALPEAEKQRQYEREERQWAREEQREQERARKQQRTARDLANFNPRNKEHRDIALKLIDAGFKALAKAAHPDSNGGDSAAMSLLNNARDYLKTLMRVK